MKNVVIVYGGKSCEHDISIITACLAKGYFANNNVYCVYIDKSNRAYLVPNGYSPAMHVKGEFAQKAVFLFGEGELGFLKRSRIVKKIKIDAAVNCCHGAHGEDGTVAALCGLLNVPVVGSGITPSAVAMDKALSKRVLTSYGVPVVEGAEIRADSLDGLEGFTKKYGYPVIVKPNTLGSSIGVKVCRNKSELQQALDVAFRYDGVVLCERALTDFYELNCAAMRINGEIAVSGVDVPVTQNDLLTFEDKYVNGQTTRPNNPAVDGEITSRVKELTKQIYSQIGFCGVIRVDYLFDNVTRQLYVNEINSIPGSLAYGLFHEIYSVTQYGDLLLEQARADFAEREKRISTFDSSVLNAASIKKK